jgi:hypothetical protein
VKLAERALDSLFITGMPKKLIGDKAYDSDDFDEKGVIIQHCRAVSTFP